MKRFFLCFAAVLFCAAMAGEADAGGIVAVDFDAVYARSVPGKAAQARLKACHARLVAQLNALRRSPAKGKGGSVHYPVHRRSMNAEMEKLRAVFEAEQKKVGSAMDGIVRRALNEYRREHPFDGVLPKKAFYRVYAPLDITEDVIRLVNSQEYSF